MTSTPSPRAARIAVLVVVTCALIGTCFAVWGFSSQQRVTSDINDVRLPAIETRAAEGEALFEHAAWALNLFQGGSATIDEVNERLEPELLAVISAQQLIDDVSFMSAEGAPFEVRGYTQSREDDLNVIAITLQAADGELFDLSVATSDVRSEGILALLILFDDERSGPFSATELIVHVIAAWGLLLAGAATWLLRHRVRAGQLLLIAGVLWLGQFLELSNSSLPYTLGLVAAPLGVAAAAVALLSYTAPGLRSATAKVVAAFVLVAGIAASAPLLAVDTTVTGLPANLLSISHDRSAAVLLGSIAQSLAVAAGVWLVVELWMRFRKGSRIGRRRRLDLAFIATLAVAVVVAVASAGLTNDHFDLSLSPLISLAALCIPVGLGLASVRERYAIGDVATMVGGDGAMTRSGLQESLARGLDDPSIALAFWSEEHGDYFSSDGRPAAVKASPERAVTILDGSDGPLAALLHDPELLNEPDRVRAATGAARLALENERLQAVVAADLRASRARLLESADAARRQVERDLHDGAQQRLIALQLALQLERQRAERSGDTIHPTFLQSISDELGGAIGELRQLSRGLRPGALDHGLRAAVDSLAERSALPIVTDVPSVRAPAAIEEAAYFVINESVANATRHSGADHIRVSVTVDDDADRMFLQVSDDGVGGAVKGRGTGLQSLEDRVLALNGRWSLESPATGGTTVRVEFPLEGKAA